MFFMERVLNSDGKQFHQYQQHDKEMFEDNKGAIRSPKSKIIKEKSEVVNLR